MKAPVPGHIFGRSSHATLPVARPGYLARIREIGDRHGALLILDEVMCGIGQTGHLFACAEDGVAPDMLTLAKGLGAGDQPIGMRLNQALRDRPIAPPRPPLTPPDACTPASRPPLWRPG